MGALVALPLGKTRGTADGYAAAEAWRKKSLTCGLGTAILLGMDNDGQDERDDANRCECCDEMKPHREDSRVCEECEEECE